MATEEGTTTVQQPPQAHTTAEKVLDLSTPHSTNNELAVVSQPPVKPPAMELAPAANEHTEKNALGASTPSAARKESKPLGDRIKACLPGQRFWNFCVGSCACQVGPCSCPVEGSGVLGIGACLVTMPVVCVAGALLGVLDCITCGGCGCCRSPRYHHSTSYTTSTSISYGGHTSTRSYTTTSYY
ncbi:hypothetical protein VTO42DRAFT_8245 [Malbranchea cinnamomea]